MRVLFICNTYMQVIVSIQMKLKFYPNDYCCLCLSDHSINSGMVAENLAKTKLFNDVRYIRTKDIYNKYGEWPNTKTGRIRQVWELFTGKSKFSKAFTSSDSNSNNFAFDIMCYYNTFMDIAGAFVEITRAWGGGALSLNAYALKKD